VIRASAKPGFAAVAATLSAKARAIGEAHAEVRAASAEAHWRSPRLLWPLFGRDRD